MTLSIQHRRTRNFLPGAFFMTDAKRCPNPAGVIKNLPGDCAVIFRDYKAPNREALALRLAGLCQKKGLTFLVAGDARLAHRVGADGIHIPEWLLPRFGFAGQVKKHWIITASAHNVGALRRAELSGADAVLLAPVFHTESHPEKAGLGIHRLQRLAAYSSLPFYALGGMNAEKMKRLPPMDNLAGVAGISLFMEKRG